MHPRARFEVTVEVIADQGFERSIDLYFWLLWLRTHCRSYHNFTAHESTPVCVCQVYQLDEVVSLNLVTTMLAFYSHGAAHCRRTSHNGQRGERKSTSVAIAVVAWRKQLTLARILVAATHNNGAQHGSDAKLMPSRLGWPERWHRKVRTGAIGRTRRAVNNDSETEGAKVQDIQRNDHWLVVSWSTSRIVVRFYGGL